MRVVANPFLWQFSTAARPAMWKSRQARCIYAEAIDAENKGDDAPHAVPGSVRVIRAPDTSRPELSPYGTPPDAAAERVRRRVAELRRMADTLESELDNYGPYYFTACPEPVPAPLHPFDAESAILGLLRMLGLQKLIVHGRTFSRDQSGAFRLEGER
jgi:hypothetical protein